MDRREAFLLALGIGASSCRRRQFKSLVSEDDNRRQKKDLTPGPPRDDSDNKNEGFATGDPTKDEKACYANPTLALEQYPEAGEALETDVRFLGSYPQNLFAMRLRKYQHGSLDSFYIVGHDGGPRYFKKLNSDDFDRRLLKTQVIESLNLKPNETFYVVFKVGTETFKSPPLKKKNTETRKGKPCYGPANGLQGNHLGFFSLVPSSTKGYQPADSQQISELSEFLKIKMPQLSQKYILTNLFGETLSSLETLKYGEWITIYYNFGKSYARRFLHVV